ncbi:Enhancing lycopene biosynthesis protein 2 [Salmonella enterica subsp. enterica serovar Daytona]|uniref:Enhancing lycopene biosynthesis protein 2 n=1 Tax=Salmonella enterica subsp. enterica serovar Daytona TaxID=1962639 RepID=A0A447JBN5_SALET|nr:Enhancing lycopene biosynthesis protein 2 [Salmonella enterica subsp. enterica serovar Daytona]
MKKIGVVLSGCGVYDGTEIHEAVLTLLAISRSGAQAICFAPDKPQADVINHLTGEAMAETRNVLIEAARITRGRYSSSVPGSARRNWMRSLCLVVSARRRT